MVNGFSVRGAGTGFAQALPAVQTQVVALGDRDNGDLSFGFNELSHNYSDVEFIRLKNFGNSPASFSVSDALAAGSPHTTSFPSSVTVLGSRRRGDRAGAAHRSGGHGRRRSDAVRRR